MTIDTKIIIVFSFLLHVSLCNTKIYYDMLIENIAKHDYYGAMIFKSLSDGNWHRNYHGNARHDDSNMFNIHINQDFYHNKAESTFFTNIYYTNNNSAFLSKMVIQSHLLTHTDYDFCVNKIPFQIKRSSMLHPQPVGKNNVNNYFGDFKIIISDDCIDFLRYVKFCSVCTNYYTDYIGCSYLFDYTFTTDKKNYYAKCRGNQYYFTDGNNNCMNGGERIFLNDIEE
ncbi:hypothetical protein BMW23_0825 [Bodo saltans virus]|uniref:Uncharacterized protein n=1 Tax=Bodo saltans virus TaxID=2024608 RepID=A0A2H4UVD1_9VIRU|nr:hypothetical protein QJ851_gp0808 [Bodo saltans virus]ATZ80871.1 hypothetical protein BMW23_0825 [Bodo saltans virus]